LFTDSSHGDQLFAPLPFSGVLSVFLPPLLCARFQFVVYCSVFFVGGVSLLRGLCWFISGVAGGILHHVCSPVWSAECLPSRFGASSWWQQQLTHVLSVMWRGEAFYRLGVQGVEVLILLGALFLPSVAPASQQGF
jgi:hypothetical protein